MRKKLIWLVILGYTALSVIMYPHFWQQLKTDDAAKNAIYGEVVASSWGMEQLYQNIRLGKNPFAYADGQLYPFGNSLLSTDSGDGFFFIFLRPWLSVNQSLSIVVIMSIVAACYGMYLLLTQLKVDRAISWMLGAAYGFTTLLQPRMGHLTYMAIYVFPWFFYSVFRAKSAISSAGKLGWPIVCAIIFALALYSNLYYFVTLVLMTIILAPNDWWMQVKGCLKQVIIFLVACLVLLSPWIYMFGQVNKFEGLPKTEGWGGAIEFSADIFGIFIPSTYSRFLGTVPEVIGTKLPFAWGIFEQHIYPGIIIIIGLFAIGWQWRIIAQKERVKLWPWLRGALVFWILTLGPFLHILGKWKISMETVPFVVPLPFALLHYLPFMSNIRSPGRLAIGMVFFAYVLIAIWLSKRELLKNKVYYIASILILGIILVLDHSFVYSPAKSHFIPRQLYQTIGNDPEKFSVYEMPSAVRDGFKYFGNLNSLDFINGQLIHKKPVIGGYFGRVPDFKRDYMANNPFLGYMGRLMDEGVENNGALDRTELPKWKNIDLENSAKAIDLVGLKYVVLQDDDFYSASAAGTLVKLNFNRIQSENNFSLWERKLSNQRVLEVMVGQPGDDMNLGVGWRGRDNNFRWGGKTISALLRISKPGTYDLKVNGASYYEDQTAEVYINYKYVGKMRFDTTMKERVLKISTPINPGICMIHLIFPHAYQPSKVEPGNNDTSMLATKISEISLDYTQ